MSAKKIAIVTGGNKGIGFAIVRGLCKVFDGDVYLTARDAGRGQVAIDELTKEGFSPKFHQLDIDDTSSIDRLRDFVREEYGGLDVLVNNAGVAYKFDSTAPFAEQAEVTVKTNYFSTMNVCQALFPLLRSHSRVVHLSSTAAIYVLSKCSEEAKERVMCVKNVGDVTGFITDFVELAKAGKRNGWPENSYGMSKLALSAVTPIQQREIDADKSRQDIVINAVCPGGVSTDMSSHKGAKTIDQGAVVPLYLALLPPNTNSPRGCHVNDKKKIVKLDGTFSGWK